MLLFLRDIVNVPALHCSIVSLKRWSEIYSVRITTLIPSTASIIARPSPSTQYFPFLSTPQIEKKSILAVYICLPVLKLDLPSIPNHSYHSSSTQ